MKHVLTEPEEGTDKEGEGGEGIRRAASYMERGEEAVAAVGYKRQVRIRYPIMEAELKYLYPHPDVPRVPLSCWDLFSYQ